MTPAEAKLAKEAEDKRKAEEAAQKEEEEKVRQVSIRRNST